MSGPVSFEKRKFPRLPVTLTAHCQLGSKFIREAVADLSQSGLFLRTRERAPEGTPVRVALALPYLDGPRFCSLTGRIARVDRDARGALRGLGVRFCDRDITATDRATLNTFLTRGTPPAL